MEVGMLWIRKMVFNCLIQGMGMFNMVYVFNFCKIDFNCHFIPVAVYEALKVMEEMNVWE